jgi:hypothetical protein
MYGIWYSYAPMSTDAVPSKSPSTTRGVSSKSVITPAIYEFFPLSIAGELGCKRRSPVVVGAVDGSTGLINCGSSSIFFPPS